MRADVVKPLLLLFGSAVFGQGGADALFGAELGENGARVGGGASGKQVRRGCCGEADGGAGFVVEAAGALRGGSHVGLDRGGGQEGVPAAGEVGVRGGGRARAPGGSAPGEGGGGLAGGGVAVPAATSLACCHAGSASGGVVLAVVGDDADGVGQRARSLGRVRSAASFPPPYQIGRSAPEASAGNATECRNPPLPRRSKSAARPHGARIRPVRVNLGC
ncbi:hypothetical protein ACLQ2P_41745 [Actinomadura citrea]|uniref:hypothetical protein n=1 Tax=Actinomadura citrea TaxID=46158 RepID=UPI003CE4AB5F